MYLAPFYAWSTATPHVTAYAGVPSTAPGQKNRVSFTQLTVQQGVRGSGGQSIGLVLGKMLVQGTSLEKRKPWTT